MTFLSICSVLLMLLVISFWTRSLGWRDAYHVKWHARRWEIITDSGKITLDDVPQHAFEYWAVEHQAEALEAKASSEGEELLRKNDFDADKWKSVEATRQKATDAKPPEPWDIENGFMERPDYRSYSISFAIPLAVVTLVPALQLLTLIVAIPGIIVRRSTFRSRMAKGLCTSCCYDLRGSPVPICPECGTPVVRRSPIAARCAPKP
jgi:hypothetical protein